MEKILYVDDDEVQRILAKRNLEEKGYTVITANDGLEALAILKEAEDPVGLVISDHSMPNMNGSDLFSKMTKLGYEAKKIGVSSLAGHQKVADEFMKAGAEIVLQKTGDYDLLAQAVYDAFNGNR